MRRVEVFTAGCEVCSPVVEQVKKLACPNCDVKIYDLREGCTSGECRDKAKQYGVKRLPAVAVDGKLLDCCKGAPITDEALRSAGIGQP